MTKANVELNKVNSQNKSVGRPQTQKMRRYLILLQGVPGSQFLALEPNYYLGIYNRQTTGVTDLLSSLMITSPLMTKVAWCDGGPGLCFNGKCLAGSRISSVELMGLTKSQHLQLTKNLRGTKINLAIKPRGWSRCSDVGVKIFLS